jgi:eukaryotic-like serine/threonine-protein kinase
MRRREATKARLRVGARLGKELTVLGVIDRRGSEGLTIVWNHAAWCPMACKVFRSYRDAEREAKVLSLLAHPNTVRFLGLSAPANLLMEFLEGPTLEDLIYRQPRRRLAISDAIRVAMYVGAALHHIHRAGYVHLDVKPANIIIAGGGRPVLYDFGSARQPSERPRSIAGTNPYIAPEECLRQRIAPATDVFGLGVTLYEMLTGELPFPLGKHRDDFPQTRLAPVPLRRRRPLSAALEGLVLSCLARDPAARPPIAGLLPRLHDQITKGQRMWPPGFHPERVQTPDGAPHGAPEGTPDGRPDATKV